MKRFFFCVILTILAGSPAMAAALCGGSWWDSTNVDCLAAKAAAQEIELAAIRQRVVQAEAAAQECAANCAPAPKATGPSKIRKDLEALAAQVAAQAGRLETLEGAEAPDSVTHEELYELLTRLDALEAEVAATVAPPPPPQMVYQPVEGPAGRDGRPAEIGLMVGGTAVARQFVGGELTLSAGGRPADGIALGGFASGFAMSATSLGFAGGVYAELGARAPAAFIAKAGWQEAGLNLTQGGAENALQGIEVEGGIALSAKSGLSAQATLGGWFLHPDDGGLTLTASGGVGFRF